MITANEVNAGDLIVYASIRNDVTPQVVSYGIALRRMTENEITGNFSSLPGTTGVPDSGWVITGPAYIAENQILALIKADKTAFDVISPLDINVGTAPSDVPAW